MGNRVPFADPGQKVQAMISTRFRWAVLMCSTLACSEHAIERFAPRSDDMLPPESDASKTLAKTKRQIKEIN